MDEPLKRFEELFQQETTGAVSIQFLLHRLQPEVAGALRLAAIPHELDGTLLEVMWPRVRGRGDALCRTLARLSMVTLIEGRLSLNRSARDVLMQEWFETVRRASNDDAVGLEEANAPYELAEAPARWEDDAPLPSFEEANARLERYFKEAVSDASGLEAGPSAAQVYHTVAADPKRGLLLLGEKVEAARRIARISTAHTVLRLVRELEPILLPGERSLLDFLDAIVAYDSNRLDAAALGLGDVVSNPATPPGTRLRALIWQGLVHRAQGRMSDALKVFEQAYDEASRVIDSDRWVERELIAALSEMAHTHLAQGDADTALKRLKEALDVARRAKDSLGAARILNGLGQALATTGQLERARRTFEEAAGLASAERDELLAARLLHNGANVAVDQGDFEAAEKLFKRSIDSKRIVHDELGEAMSLAALASVLWQQGRNGEAEGSIARAIAIFDDVGDIRHASLARQNRARRYLKAGRVDLAREDCKIAMRDLRRIGLEDLAAGCQADLAGLDAQPNKKGRWLWWIIGIVLIVILVITLA